MAARPICASLLAALLMPLTGLAEEPKAEDEDLFYADRFVLPDDDGFLEEDRSAEEGEEDGAESLSQLQRKDASPYEPYYRAGAKVFDGAIVRVPALGSLVVGSALFAVSAPVAAAAGTMDEAMDVFVRSPYRFAIQRPLGSFAD